MVDTRRRLLSPSFAPDSLKELCSKCVSGRSIHSEGTEMIETITKIATTIIDAVRTAIEILIIMLFCLMVVVI